MPTLPLPADLARLINAHKNEHPGLALEKYVCSNLQPGEGKFSEKVQQPAITEVVSLSQRCPAALDWSALRRQREAMLSALGAQSHPCQTAGPMTLHLSRASALENAGICLHRVYGFVYLPGTGVKGLARAYAETIAKADKKLVAKIFGSIDKGEAAAGKVVFHDAWPLAWPRLVRDVLTPHVGSYYGTRDGDNAPDKAPGDWGEPKPVNFLSVAPGTAFDFPLSKGRNGTDDDVRQAGEWLLGGLIALGAGAKTAAGYGAFLPTPECPDLAPKGDAKLEEFTLTLETPAFLAGADQLDAAGCDLRPSTLRGMLRWWWRTLHAGFVTVAELRRLEAAVFGSTTIGGAARFTLKREDEGKAIPFGRDAIHAQNRLPTPTNGQNAERNRVATGLMYHTYGMDDMKDGARVTRPYLPPGATWTARLTAKASRHNGKEPVSRELVAEQARAALWLLCTYGGVGAKCRKGFGSFAVPANLSFTLDECRAAAERLRAACGLGGRRFTESLARSPSFEQTQGLIIEPLPTEWKNVWHALDRVAAAAQDFAARNKHKRPKKALGLPRIIGNPAVGDFRPDALVKDRHASPVWYHLSKRGDKFEVRVTAFPAWPLPNLPASKEMLGKLVASLRVSLDGSRGDAGAVPAAVFPTPGRGAVPPPPAGVPALKAGSLVTGVFIRQSAAGNWIAQIGTRSGTVMNSKEVPASASVGDSVSLTIKLLSVDGRGDQYTYKPS